MTLQLYNSALKNKTYTVDSEPTEHFKLGHSIGRRWNIVSEPPPQELYKCDVAYCEPPFPAGIKIFDERAGETTASYQIFIEKFVLIWETITVPKYAIINSRLLKKLPKPDGIKKIKLNQGIEQICWWNDAPEPPIGVTNLALCNWLGSKFTCMADITCGYGSPLIHFCMARPGNSFFGSDYDPHCITVLKQLALKNLNLS